MPSSIIVPENFHFTMYSSLTKKANSPLKKSVMKLMNNPVYQLFMSGLLFISLFMADSWILGNALDSTNDRMFATLLGIFIVFCVEMLVLLTFQDDYFPYFFFWMDLLGTFSIVIDIGWIADSFIPNSTIANQGSVVRATRAAKLGARYGRLLRLIRLMRFVRWLPCFSSYGEEDFEPSLKAVKKVSDELSSRLSLRTAMLVLLLVIVVPFLNYTATDYSANAWITNFKMLSKNETTSWYDIENAARKCYNFYLPKDSCLYELKIESPWFPEQYKERFHTRDNLRHNNINTFDSSYFVSNQTLLESGNPFALEYLNNAAANERNSMYGYVEFKIRIKLDNTYPNQQDAMFNILLIILVIICLFGFTASFNGSVNTLVVKPLEKMMGTLRNNAMIMLKSMKAVETAKEEEEEKKKKNSDDGDEDDEEDDDFESAMLEKMVEKLSRIVKHVFQNDEIAVDGNIDKNTANWLNQSYTTGPAMHNPKELLRAESVIPARSQQNRLLELVSASIREELTTWDYDVLKYSNEELTEAMIYIFASMNFLDIYQIPETKLRTFFTTIAGRYINNTYHNYKHGCDVCFTSYRLLTIPNLNHVFSQLEVFSVLTGAIAHDVGHPGLNNLFLTKSKHELAIKHNDRSPLENMHCVVLYEILGKDESNIFSNLEEKQWRESRKIILTIILGTDMSHHFEQISKTQLFLEVNGEDTKAFCSGAKDEIACLSEEKNRLFIMELVLHCSDISNPFKPFNLCAAWADLVVEEFCLQGDKEKQMGLEVSPMCDRDTINLCNMQMGFIEFVVSPLIIAFVNIFPPLHEIASNLLNNHQSWGEKRKLEIMNDEKMDDSTKPEECRKMDERLGKFKDKMSFVSVLRDSPIRKGAL